MPHLWKAFLPGRFALKLASLNSNVRAVLVLATSVLELKNVLQEH